MSDSELARAVSTILSDSRWAGAVLARAAVALAGGATDEAAARALYQSGCYTLTKARSLIQPLKEKGFVALIDERTRTGSAENPVTKLFPGAVTERHFLACLDEQTQPKRTPGIGLRAWGTGASAEVNVHVSIHHETKPWDELDQRIRRRGLPDIIGAINRKRTEVVFDPEL